MIWKNSDTYVIQTEKSFQQQKFSIFNIWSDIGVFDYKNQPKSDKIENCGFEKITSLIFGPKSGHSWLKF